jgi:hypothetical protein
MANQIAAKNLSQLIEETRLLIGDSSDVSNTWSQSDVVSGINYAIQTYCRLTNCNYVEETRVIDDYGKTSAPVNDYLTLERCKYNSKILLLTSKQEEEMKNPQWETKIGTPLRWLVYDGKSIKVTPYPTSNKNITLGYVKNPLIMSLLADTVDSSIPLPHHIYIKYAAASWLFMIDGDKQDIEQSLMYMQLFNQFIGIQTPQPNTRRAE